MKAHYFIPAILSICLVACAETKDEYETAVDEASAVEGPSGEWISLFDGTSFDNWRGYQQESMPDGWQLVDGAMFMSDPGPGGDLVTKEQFANFELRFEWMVPEAGNSGVMFRVTEDHGAPYATGPEYQTLDDAHHTDGQSSKNSAGSNYDIHAPIMNVVKPFGEWNTGRIVANRAHVEHWLNGEKIVEYELWTDQWKADVAASKWVGYPDYGMRETGYIALQGDHTGASYRNIDIRIF